MAEVHKGNKAVVSTPPVYDPSKSYMWQPDDNFVLSGTEFAQLYQLIKTDALSTGISPITPLQRVRAFDFMEKVLSLAVENHVATEIPPPLELNPLPHIVEN